jgi:hypothetical protein
LKKKGSRRSIFSGTKRIRSIKLIGLEKVLKNRGLYKRDSYKTTIVIRQLFLFDNDSYLILILI